MDEKDKGRLLDAIVGYGKIFSNDTCLGTFDSGRFTVRPTVEVPPIDTARIIASLKDIKHSVPRKPKRDVEVKLDPHGGTKRNKAKAKLKKKSKQKNRR